MLVQKSYPQNPGQLNQKTAITRCLVGLLRLTLTSHSHICTSLADSAPPCSSLLFLSFSQNIVIFFPARPCKAFRLVCQTATFSLMDSCLDITVYPPEMLCLGKIFLSLGTGILLYRLKHFNHCSCNFHIQETGLQSI